MPQDIYAYTATNNQQQAIALSDYQGKLLLIVNTASACGFTPQYQGLQSLYEKYQKQGLEIIAFPCNQFREQEKGDDSEIKNFCDLNFNIQFPLFSKIEVNGENTHPLYLFLKEQAPGILGSKSIKWNFTKFLVTRDGQVHKRYAPSTKPAALEGDIERLL